MFAGSLGEMVMVFGDFIGIEQFFRLFDGYVVVFGNGE